MDFSVTDVTNVERTKMPKSLIGTTFRSVIGDENVLFKVTSKLAADTWECVAKNEPYVINGQSYNSDNAGLVKPFDGADIRSAKKFEELWNNRNDERKQFWADQKIGSILH
jgi:hypothetical protein